MKKTEWIKRDIDLEYRAIADEFLHGIDVRKYLGYQCIKLEQHKLLDLKTREYLRGLLEDLTPANFFEFGRILVTRLLDHKSKVLDADYLQQLEQRYYQLA